jgi:ribulose 1,5-bisphosphate carboxylase large subunit-like protein
MGLHSYLERDSGEIVVSAQKGGTHGHSRGSRAGARANRVATEAVASGKTLDDAAKTCPELREAMELWGKVKFGVTD